jgi:acetylornithine deacetylase/succinyl-diaminopimelate desuccinylase-like protein
VQTQRTLVPLLLLVFSASVAIGQTLDVHQQLAHDIFKQLVDIDTTDEHGNVTTAAQAVADRLRSAGFPPSDVQLVGPSAKKMNVIARIHGQGKAKPTLWLAHLDVVEARKQDWSQGLDPFQFTEKDGYYYGRGTSDIKDGASILVANFIRLHQENYQPAGDLILALTADEEGGNANGVDWLIKNRRDLIDAAYCINLDGGDANKYNGVRKVLTIQAAEKSYADYDLLTTNRGGHSSLPRPDNAIYDLTRAIDNLAAHSFPVHLNQVTKGYFKHTATIETGQTSLDMKALAAGSADQAAIHRLSNSPLYNSLMRTTCVATMMNAGHARNALPQRAEANVNCRIVPGETPQSVLAELQKIVHNPKVEITIKQDNGIQPVVAPLATLRPEIVSRVEAVTAQVFPGVIVMPEMSTGASDGKYLNLAGIPTYGISGLFDDVNDVRAHGRDERIAVKDYYDGLEFNYRLMKTLAR